MIDVQPRIELDPLDHFLGSMDALADLGLPPAEMAAEAGRRLAPVLARPSCLPDRFRAGDPDRYQQHVVHVHRRGAYSLVALVWLPGQATPVHDHRCWCVVGVLEGAEFETPYLLRSAGGDEWLEEGEPLRNLPGSVSVLVPPAENIHRVANAGDRLAVSLHVYGADISVVGTSINQVFTQSIRPAAPGASGSDVSWRVPVT